MSPKASELEVGQEIGRTQITVDRATFVRYAGASGDFNPIHWDEKFATSVGLPSVIGHGMWTMGAAVSLVGEWVGDPGRVVEYGVRFSAPVVVEYDSATPLAVTGTIKKIDGDRVTVELTATQGGTKVLSRALATVDLSGR
ncbi:acyl dehydratase [Yimella sp. RIT 621]|uniref:MaoC/PaaZ C-terminal domain-containing protein n=1 Tax=Yimella sp. RIT 621 TaxID=2510323 RepID=UPI00101D0FAB|nr:MaoC/PaaZ C-terminal domain-containing protein [Yimella sp. RIT 621]RYG78156.1 acyl dehydratase [Yimella sp. RIT 621]